MNQHRMLRIDAELHADEDGIEFAARQRAGEGRFIVEPFDGYAVFGEMIANCIASRHVFGKKRKIHYQLASWMSRQEMRRPCGPAGGVLRGAMSWFRLQQLDASTVATRTRCVADGGCDGCNVQLRQGCPGLE
ncbi:hypothetical protein LGM65_30890 [Burkholderia anthina]|uniref:hypothetical protein n=1 Tax=Burkholderia anthina TaxID=179879 RepID=UPI001CF37DD8|nr:hypothetical protein [Burkholderia anthina]MCA8095230.1 hypothetical protein [Burkholderia anthina]